MGDVLKFPSLNVIQRIQDNLPKAGSVVRVMAGDQALLKSFDEALSSGVKGRDLLKAVESLPDFRFIVRQDEKLHIPRKGPLLFVVNQPLCLNEWLELFCCLSRLRSDLKLAPDPMLDRVQQLNDFRLVDDESVVSNELNNSMGDVSAYLLTGGAVLMAPSKKASRIDLKGIQEGRWSSRFLSWAERSHAVIVPLSYDTQKLLQHHAASYFQKPLKQWKLRKAEPDPPKEFLLRIGNSIEPSVYEMLSMSPSVKARLFRKEVARLGKGKRSLFRSSSTIADPEDPKLLQGEIDRCLVLGETRDGMRIVLYRYCSGSILLSEIGRLRELAFRLIGEGTGKESDTDHYDRYYEHIVLWDDSRKVIAGAYRLAAGVQALDGGQLYTQSLFQYGDAAQKILEQGLELGRSFVHPDYWGSRSLDYLWVGIAAYLRAHPHYRYLLGAVSISNSFSLQAKDALVYFYRHYYGAKSHIATGLQPYALGQESEAYLVSMFQGKNAKEAFQALKDYLDQLGFSVPVLYKQYTALCEPGGVRFHGFNVDPDFSDCIDGLVIVDLDALLPSKRKRYQLEDYKVVPRLMPRAKESV